MQGTITTYKRNGRIRSYGYRFRVKGQDGAWRWKSKRGFDTRRKAEEAQRLALLAAGQKPEHQPIEPRRVPTFEKVLEQFLADAECTLGTLEAYRKASRYPVRAFGSHAIDTITTADLQKLFKELRLVGGDRGRPLSPKTLKHIRFLVKCVFDVAVDHKYVASSPLTKKVKTPKLRDKEFNMPEKHRLKEVIQQARGRRIYPILEVTSATGARMGEILALQWPDYDAEGGTLKISKALEDTKFGVRVKGTKSERPRIVSLPASVLAVLEEHRQIQARDKETAGQFYDDQGYIFCPPRGGFYRPSNISTRVSEFFRKHGMALSMHKLRHAHGSILLSEGAPITAVSDRLGHKKPSITLALYSHVIPGDRQRLALMWDDDRRKAKVVEMFPHVPKKRDKSA
jgi:integrase